MIRTETLELQTRGNCEVVDITERVAQAVRASGLKEGSAIVFVTGSTAGVTTVEYEPGLVRDLGRLFERLVPAGERYDHDYRWGDGNGHSHVRASLLGPSLTVPFAEGRLMLGTWQQVVLLDFDIRPRTRRVVIQLQGE